MSGQRRLGSPIVSGFFTNKIPDTLEDWFDTLVVVASVYAKFDGLPYDRDAMLSEFAKIASRNEETTRDPADFRDEYGAYGSFLGIFYVEREAGVWVGRMSKAAKDLLCGHAPNPEAFCRLQMALYQYPDGMGLRIQSVRPALQANSRDAKIRQIRERVLFAPFRVILRLLLMLNDSEESRPEAFLTHDELFELFNDPRVYRSDYSRFPEIAAELAAARREGRLPPRADANFGRNFHILVRTGLVKKEGDRFMLDTGERDSPKDTAARVIAGMDQYFREFENMTGSPGEMERRLVAIIASGSWGRYFDSASQMGYDAVSAISTGPEPPPAPAAPERSAPFPELRRYRLFRFPGGQPSAPPRGVPDYSRGVEVREKRNARHREILDLLCKKLIALGADPQDNEFIDQTASFGGPNYLFEAKTVSESGNDILDRVREAVAQLLEYRYRSREEITNPRLVILLGRDIPPGFLWLYDYLAGLGITACWVCEDGICAREADRGGLGAFVDSYR